MIRTMSVDLAHQVAVEMLPVLRQAMDPYQTPEERVSFLRRVRSHFAKAVKFMIRSGRWEKDFRLYQILSKVPFQLTLAINASPDELNLTAQAVQLVECIESETAPFPFEPPY